MTDPAKSPDCGQLVSYQKFVEEVMSGSVVIPVKMGIQLARPGIQEFRRGEFETRPYGA
jgi:hypothetical protein